MFFFILFFFLPNRWICNRWWQLICLLWSVYVIRSKDTVNYSFNVHAFSHLTRWKLRMVIFLWENERIVFCACLNPFGVNSSSYPHRRSENACNYSHHIKKAFSSTALKRLGLWMNVLCTWNEKFAFFFMRSSVSQSVGWISFDRMRGKKIVNNSICALDSSIISNAVDSLYTIKVSNQWKSCSEKGIVKLFDVQSFKEIFLLKKENNFFLIHLSSLSLEK